MYKMDPTVGKWFGVLNDMGRDIACHARDEYDTFLEKCLKPYGIDKLNSGRNADRVRIEEENPNIHGFESVSYHRFYIDDEYKFTMVIKYGPTVSGQYNAGFQYTYEAVVEQDRVPKKINMTNKEAAEILETVREMSTSKEEDEAFNLAIAALEEQDKYKWIFQGIGEPWDSMFKEIEKALGFKLFYWQKYYILNGAFRRSGKTTALILRDLLRGDTEGAPLDYTLDASYREELLKIKEKLNKAGIKTLKF